MSQSETHASRSNEDIKDMGKTKLMRNLKHETYCRIGISTVPGAGVGVIAIRPIPEGTNPFRRCDKITDDIVHLTPEEVEKLPQGVKRMVKDFFLPTKDGLYPVVTRGLNGMDISFYLNHSDDPNLDYVAHDGPYYDFVTNRRIKPGEELFIRY